MPIREPVFRALTRPVVRAALGQEQSLAEGRSGASGCRPAGPPTLGTRVDRVASLVWQICEYPLGATRIHAATVEPGKIARVLGLRRRVASLEQQVEAWLPEVWLGAVARHVYGDSTDATALMQRAVPAATFHRWGDGLKRQDGERVERLAQVIATAEYVWNSADVARIFVASAHTMLGGKRPIRVALTELGARWVENLLWSLFHGADA